MDAIERTNWLAHRWPIELETYSSRGWLIHVGKVEGHRLGQINSAAEFETWRAAQRPLCLARFVAGRRELHPYRRRQVPPGPYPACAVVWL
jgi:hypothetical protein